MNIVLHPTGKEASVEALQILVAAVDRDFTPPLSQRHGTHQHDFDTVDGTHHAYIDQLCRQHTLIAYEGGQPIGFLSYVEHDEYVDAHVHEPVVYVTTIAVRPHFRGHGVAQQLYASLFDMTQRIVVLRTWSTNDSHINLLKKLGFVESARWLDHRGPGIDTVYFLLERL